MNARQIWPLLLLCLSLWVPAARAATVPPLACSATSKLSDFTPEWNTGQTMSAPLTMMLADDGSAELLFHQPLATTTAGATAANEFLAFEVWHPIPVQFGPGAPLTIYSVDQAPAHLGGDLAAYLPQDSTELQLGIDPRPYSPWQRRYFVIVECSGGAVASWGLVAARVSNTVWAFSICVALALVSYLFWITSIWNRNSKLPIRARFSAWRKRKRAAAAPPPNTAEEPDTDETYLAKNYPAIFRTPKITWVQSLNPIHLTVNEFGEPSVQKFQVIMFSFLVAALVLFVLLRTAALVDLSDTIVALMGISTVGAATAKIAYQQRTRLSFDNWAWLQQRGVLKFRDEIKPIRWGDLVLTNREFDIYKMQTIIFSLVVACALLIAGGSDLATFTVPETLLGILGLSQVTYIGGVLVQPPAVNDLDDALTRLRAAFDLVSAARDQKTDIDANGILISPPSTTLASTDIAKNAIREYCKLALNIVPMIESTLEVRVNQDKLEPNPATPCCFKAV